MICLDRLCISDLERVSIFCRKQDPQTRKICFLTPPEKAFPTYAWSLKGEQRLARGGFFTQVKTGLVYIYRIANVPVQLGSITNETK